MCKIIIDRDVLLLKGAFDDLMLQKISSPVILEADSVTEEATEENAKEKAARETTEKTAEQTKEETAEQTAEETESDPLELTIAQDWEKLELYADAVELLAVPYSDSAETAQGLILRVDELKLTGTENGNSRTLVARNVNIYACGVVTRLEASQVKSEDDAAGKDLLLPEQQIVFGESETERETTATILPQEDQATSKPTLSFNVQILPGIVLAAAVIAAALAVWQRRRIHEKKTATQASEPARGTMSSALAESSGVLRGAPEPSANLMVGKLHHIGKRSSQQDSLGLIQVQGGILAVIADGMGGLSDGDRVSQKIVYTMLNDGTNRKASVLSGNLVQLLSHANAEVNQMLGEPGHYVSGSTVILVLAEPNQFQWVSVGDSRLYLYRGGALLQINREHVYESELLGQAVNREISFQEARSHAKKKSVTSFVGMGELKHVDVPLQPVKTWKGDKLLLMTDGVFNTLSEDEIAAILAGESESEKAAAALEAAVLAKNNPNQDNFTAILICYQ